MYEIESEDLKFAIIHTAFEIGAKKRNIEKVNQLLEKITQRGEQIDFVILPQMLNGVAMYENVARKTGKSIKNVGEKIPGELSEELIATSSRYNVGVIAGPILERRGSRLYRSVMIVLNGELRAVLRQVFAEKNIGSYKGVPYADLGSIKVGVLIAEDVLYPDIALFFSLAKPHILIVFPSLDKGLEEQLALAKARAIECGCAVIFVGGTFTYRHEILSAVPTVVVDENGANIEFVGETDEKILILNVKKRESLAEPISDKERLKFIKHMLRFIRKA
jgi:predicted amidohydrolase